MEFLYLQYSTICQSPVHPSTHHFGHSVSNTFIHPLSNQTTHSFIYCIITKYISSPMYSATHQLLASSFHYRFIHSFINYPYYIFVFIHWIHLCIHAQWICSSVCPTYAPIFFFFFSITLLFMYGLMTLCILSITPFSNHLNFLYFLTVFLAHN